MELSGQNAAPQTSSAESASSGTTGQPLTTVESVEMSAMKTPAGANGVPIAAPAQGDTDITARLLYRRAYKTLMDLKKWDVPDIVMAEKNLKITPR